MLTSDVCQQNGLKQNFKVVQGCTLEPGLFFIYWLLKKILSTCCGSGDFEKKVFKKQQRFLHLISITSFMLFLKVLPFKFLHFSVFLLHQFIGSISQEVHEKFHILNYQKCKKGSASFFKFGKYILNQRLQAIREDYQ